MHMSKLITLRNLASSAPWVPRFYDLDLVAGKWIAINDQERATRVAGLGSHLITIINGRLARRFLAIYKIEGTWFVFDGDREIVADHIHSTWSSGPFAFIGVGTASLTLATKEATKTIHYWRPWLRHWFEGGWALSDIDIACVIEVCLSDSVARLRLGQALPRAPDK